MNWFKVEVRTGEKGTYHYVGTADATLESLAQQMQAGQAIRLDHLLYYDRGKAKDWESWDKTLVPSVVINAKEVVTIMRFKGDPCALAHE
jgi:hypothetical protein